MKTKGNAVLAASIAISIVAVCSLTFLSRSPAAAAANFDPGLALMTSSHDIFQIDTFSTDGKIASLSFSQDTPMILSGNWNITVNSNMVTNFRANINAVKADGSESLDIVLTNFSSHQKLLTNTTDGSRVAIGTVDIFSANHTNLRGVPVIVTIEKFKAVNIALGRVDAGSFFLEGQRIYGTVNQPGLTTITATAAVPKPTLPEGSSTPILGNASPVLRMPSFPNLLLK